MNVPSGSLLTRSLVTDGRQNDSRWLVRVGVAQEEDFQESEAVASSGMSGQPLNPWRQSPPFPVEIQLLNCLAGAL